MALLKASIGRLIELRASVSEFTRSVGARVLINFRASVHSLAMTLKNSRMNIKNTTSVFVDGFVEKIAKVNIFPKVSVMVSTRVFKEARVNMVNKVVIGSETTLEILDELVLSEMDDKTLDELEFVEGIYVNVLKYARANFESRLSVDIETYKFRYQKLLDHDTTTLGILDNLTLVEMDELPT